MYKMSISCYIELFYFFCLLSLNLLVFQYLLCRILIHIKSYSLFIKFLQKIYTHYNKYIYMRQLILMCKWDLPEHQLQLVFISKSALSLFVILTISFSSFITFFISFLLTRSLSSSFFRLPFLSNIE